MSEFTQLKLGALEFINERALRPEWVRDRFRNAEVFFVFEHQGTWVVAPLAWAWDAQNDGWRNRTASSNTGIIQRKMRAIDLQSIEKGSPEHQRCWRLSKEFLQEFGSSVGFSERSNTNGRKRERRALDNVYYLLSSPHLEATVLASEDELQSLDDFQDAVSNSLNSDAVDRRARLTNARNKPRQVTTYRTTYIRNPDVVAERLHLAHGQCGSCLKSAPFRRISNGQPFLEVHHIQPLSEGGDDTVKNTVALCPNCHRQAHYG